MQAIPAEQRNPVFSKTAARIFSHSNAARPNLQFLSLNDSFDIDSNQLSRPVLENLTIKHFHVTLKTKCIIMYYIYAQLYILHCIINTKCIIILFVSLTTNSDGELVFQPTT